MGSTPQVYSVEEEIANFFSKTSTTRDACDSHAQKLVGGRSTPVRVQGACSYTVYAGPEDGLVVQFRLKSLELKPENAILARQVFGSLAPDVSCRGEVGSEDDDDGKESLCVYVMTRVPGVSHLDFNLAHDELPNSPEFCGWRKNLLSGVASFFALAWKSPQEVTQAQRDALSKEYGDELHLLLASLPTRFRPAVRGSIDSLPAIMNLLPMVLLHKDFGTCNIMVDKTTCHLVGVIDWAEAEIGPFGLNLYTLQALMSTLHLKNGRTRYVDYDILQDVFWTTFCREVGELDEGTICVIKAAMIMGLLLSKGFTYRLANKPRPVPIKDDENGAYNMLILDGLLINPATKISDFTA